MKTTMAHLSRDGFQTRLYRDGFQTRLYRRVSNPSLLLEPALRLWQLMMQEKYWKKINRKGENNNEKEKNVFRDNNVLS